MCSVNYAVLVSTVAGYSYFDFRYQEQRAHRQAVDLLFHKTEDLKVETFPNHYRTHYDDYSDTNLSNMLTEISKILQSNPDAKLFHYNNPDKTWLRRGYAILLDTKIVWEQRLQQT